jgi:uncharacterized membrane protein
MRKSTLLTVRLVTTITASLVASSADADRGDKIKEKIKKAFEKVKEKRGGGGTGPGGSCEGQSHQPS